MLAPFKYAGYPMLLQAVALPPDTTSPEAGSQHFLAAERTLQLQVKLASKLCMPLRSSPCCHCQLSTFTQLQ